jgi:Ca2+-binding RTX toxin-like protein
VDQAAGFDYTITWGDGATDGPLHAGSPLSRSHTYSAVGVYTVTMTATDKDGGTSTAVTKTVTISGTSVVPTTCGTGTDLLIGGTSGNDTIKLAPSGSGIKVTVNNVVKGTFFPTNQLVIYGQGGNDTITIDTHISTPRLVYGGAGDDNISGGNGNGTTLGGDGNDTISTGNGRDVLIGGTGTDTLKGGNGDDILIAGSTSYDAPTAANQAALCAIAKEWDSGSSYMTRILHLTGAQSGGLNGATKLITTGPGRTVFDDTSKDTLTGSLGSDWFLLNRTGGTVLDKSDATSAEIATDLQ